MSSRPSVPLDEDAIVDQVLDLVEDIGLAGGWLCAAHEVVMELELVPLAIGQMAVCVVPVEGLAEAVIAWKRRGKCA
jgi:hypothetical protein